MQLHQKHIEKILYELDQISTNIYLVDLKGKIYNKKNNINIELPNPVPIEEFFYISSLMGYRCNALQDFVFACDKESENGKDLLLLASILGKHTFKKTEKTNDIFDLYRDAILDQLDEDTINKKIEEFGVNPLMERSLIVLRSNKIDKIGIINTLKEVVPQNDKNILIVIDDFTAVLVIEDSEIKNLEDLIEFAKALDETISTEVDDSFAIGLGARTKEFKSLNKSYEQALKAINMGKIFFKKNDVFSYEKMILQRIIFETPKKIRREFTSSFFNKKTAKMLDDEMQRTIKVFFESNLNISDTARQLYIHRNTLMYRLDKIYKTTNLDIRKFKDALIFKILMEMRIVDIQQYPKNRERGKSYEKN